MTNVQFQMKNYNNIYHKNIEEPFHNFILQIEQTMKIHFQLDLKFFCS